MVQYIVNFTDPEVTPFTINSFTTDGPAAPNTLQLSSTAVRASTGLLLYGKGHPSYGERIQENLINLMENFSGATEPTFPISGQTWFARVTHVLLEYGSPGTLEVYRWEDDDTNPNGGSWIALNDVGSADPTAADDVKTSGGRPATVVDGSFWLDTDGSPVVPELYLGVNNSTSNFSARFLKRELDNVTTDFAARSIDNTALTSGLYKPQKQLKVYDGVQWKNAGAVFNNVVPPQRPSEGDLWYNTTGSPGTDHQLFIWSGGNWEPTGYVSTTGDILTGSLQFADAGVGSLYLWENDGDSSTGSDIRFVDNGLLSSNDNLYIHINNDAGSPQLGGSDVFEVAVGSDARDGTQVSLFQVRGDGVIRTALTLGSPEGSVYSDLITTSGDGNSLTNRGYVDNITDGIAGDVSDHENRITQNESDIVDLAGGDIEAKVNRSGDTMTGTLLFDPVAIGSPKGIAIDLFDLRIANLQLPVIDEDAASKKYVDNQIIIAGGNDGVVDGVFWVPTTRELQLTRTEGLPDLLQNLIHDHPTDEVNHTVTTSFLRDIYAVTGSPITAGSPLPYVGSPTVAIEFTQESINNLGLQNLHSRISNFEAPNDREVFVVGVGSPLGDGSPPTGGSPVLALTTFSFTEGKYIAGTNRLFVYVNGVKQYANERAYQKIKFNTGQDLSPSAKTGLLNTDTNTYTLTITVDGGSPSETMSAQGNELLIIQDIIDQINSDVVGVTAVWSEKDTAIVVYSNLTGIGSSINIQEEGFGSPGNDLLVALTGGGSPSPGSPSLGIYTLGNIVPVAGGPISTVITDFAYREVSDGSPVIDATYGEETSTVIFNTQLTPGDVVEMIGR